MGYPAGAAPHPIWKFIGRATRSALYEPLRCALGAHIEHRCRLRGRMFFYYTLRAVVRSPVWRLPWIRRPRISDASSGGRYDDLSACGHR